MDQTATPAAEEEPEPTGRMMVASETLRRLASLGWLPARLSCRRLLSIWCCCPIVTEELNVPSGLVRSTDRQAVDPPG